MEKIFILGNSETVRQLGYNFVEIPSMTNDYEIHNWIVSLFQKYPAMDKVVIEIGSAPVLSLKIGLHIRLSIDELQKKSLIPLFFVSAFSLNFILIENKGLSHILASKGVHFSTFDNIENIKIELPVIEGISPEEYKTGFLDIVKILPDENIGRHSLANIWGAYSMDKAANMNALNHDIDFQRNKAKLYFKYISAFNKLNLFSVKIVGRINIGKTKTIKAPNKKIFLIDDEADKGWELVLRKIFKTSTPEDFVVIKEKVKDYDNLSIESRNLIENTSFDLYLVDLRLNGAEEENTLKSDDFSGMKVLQKIKSCNQGNQVIVFTASNKVWNLKALLDAGADGYYMKESPEFGFSVEFSEQNYLRFQEDVRKCFERNYLKEIFSDIQIIKAKLKSLKENGFKQEIENQIDLFWNMVSKAQIEMDYAYSYVTLYMVIEIINKQFISEINKEYVWNNEAKQYDCKDFENKTAMGLAEWQKMAFLYFQKWGQTKNKFISEVYDLIRKRNGFIHNDTSISYKDVYTQNGIVKLFEIIKKIIVFCCE